MQIVADLHLHSRYSRAVSPKMDLQENARFAMKKGIHLLSTADWMHPLWFKELSSHLSETEPGIYSIPEYPEIRFLLSTEISSIYSQGGKVRRIHNLIFSPSLKTCEKINQELVRRGANLMSDGRPIVGISARDLLALVLEIDKDVLLVPAHAWTPWYSIFGSNSGFDSIEECFGDLSKYIYAIETGLSSDPLMNWQIKELETRSILSFSDAHSSPKLGREATVFVSKKDPKSDMRNAKFSYDDIVDAIKRKPDAKFRIGYTIEFFPEEGKYHWSGHRACNIIYSPEEVKANGKICPVCNRPLTIGVENRVIDLSERIIGDDGRVFTKSAVGTTFVYDKEKRRVPFVSAVPLLEILTELSNGSPIKAQREYERLTEICGTEFDILLKKSLEELQEHGGEKFASAVQIMRNRNVYIRPGFDGVFGIVKIFKEDEKTKEAIPEKKEASRKDSQTTLF